MLFDDFQPQNHLRNLGCLPECMLSLHTAQRGNCASVLRKFDQSTLSANHAHLDFTPPQSVCAHLELINIVIPQAVTIIIPH